MAGHSKWANIQHRKGKQDKLRAKLFSKLSKEITVAAKMGDPDPEKNPRLRLAVKAAKGVSMPKDVIDRAIKKSSGGDAEDYTELRYEGYGPNGIAVIVETMTDNVNRTVANVRCGGTDVATAQVRSGMAWVYAGYADAHSHLVPLQRQAQSSGTGLWSHPPAQRRRAAGRDHPPGGVRRIGQLALRRLTQRAGDFSALSANAGSAPHSSGRG